MGQIPQRMLHPNLAPAIQRKSWGSSSKLKGLLERTGPALVHMEAAFLACRSLRVSLLCPSSQNQAKSCKVQLLPSLTTQAGSHSFVVTM